MEKKLAEQLKHFPAVWSRVTAARSPEALAARHGLKLMPKGRRRKSG